MKTPDFWRGAHPDWRAQILAPFGFAFGAIAAQKLKHCGPCLQTPSILVGNFTAGGAGKTPTILALAALLKKRGETPALIARGYGGSAGRTAPLCVTPQDDHAHGQRFRIFGDEALLLARVAPTYIGVDRLRAAHLAIEEVQPSILLFDDGLQSRRIEPTLAFAVVDGELGFGNGYCIPAGPLRAPVAAQWPLVSAVIVIGAGAAGKALAQEALKQGKSVFFAQMELQQIEKKAGDRGMAPHKNISSIKKGRFVAFAGIGYPEKFFSALKKEGAELVKIHAFPDHHPYTAKEINMLSREARQFAARLITTEKDFMRLPEKAPFTAESLQTIAVTLKFTDETAIQRYLEHYPL